MRVGLCVYMCACMHVFLRAFASVLVSVCAFEFALGLAAAGLLALAGAGLFGSMSNTAGSRPGSGVVHRCWFHFDFCYLYQWNDKSSPLCVKINVMGLV